MKNLFSLILICILTTVSAGGAVIPPAQKPLRDEASIMDLSGAAAVRQICNNLERDTGAELAVLIMRTTSGENAHDFALRIFNKWGIGRVGLNNGMLIMFAINDRRVEIIPGIRYKSYFDETTCTSLLVENVVPKMRAGNPREGVLAATRVVADRVREFEGKGKSNTFGASKPLAEKREIPGKSNYPANLPAGSVSTREYPKGGQESGAV